jgi:hypothetical protein
VTDPTQPEPFAAPYVLNESSVTIQNGEEIWPASAPPPRPPRQRPWLVPVVILGVVALLGGLVGAGVAEFQAIGERVAAVGSDSNDSVPQPIITTKPAPPGPMPTAFSATCAKGCLTVASSGLMIPNYSLLGSMPINRLSVSPDFQHPTTEGLEYQADSAAWGAQSPTSDLCFFTGSRSPVSPIAGAPTDVANDPITFLGESVDLQQGTTMTQTARFFSSPGDASTYQSWVRGQVLDCQAADPRVEPAAGFELPPSVTAVAFVEKSANLTTYTYDFARANAVVRFRVVTSDNVDENAVRHFLGTWVTTDLAQLELN